MGCLDQRGLDPTKRPTCPSQHKVHTKSHILWDSGYFGILRMGNVLGCRFPVNLADFLLCLRTFCGRAYRGRLLGNSKFTGNLQPRKCKWKPKIGWESRQKEDKADVFYLPWKPHLFPSQNSISYATTSMEDTASAFPIHSTRGI